MLRKRELGLKVRELEVELQRAIDHERTQAGLNNDRNVMKVRGELVEEQLKLRSENAALKVKVDQLEKRVAEAPYEQLSQILKALVVKLPTLNVSSLNVETKGK